MPFEEMNWKEIEAMDKDTILFLTIGPMEEHGPHLPVGTDFFIAKYRMARDFVGTISIEWKLIRGILHQIFLSMSKMGFKYIIICNFHMDLHHIKAIHSAISKAKGMVICEPISSYYFKGTLWHADDKKEVHADMKETSLALFAFPHLAKQWDALPPVKIKMDGPDALFKTMKEMGAKEGYVGSPSLASEKYGEEMFKKLVDIVIQTAEKMVAGDKLPDLPPKIKILLKLIK